MLCGARHKDLDVALVVHSSWYVDDSGRRVGQLKPPLGKTDRTLAAGELSRFLLVQNTLAVPSVAFRRDQAIEVGGMDERLWYTADWDLWLKLAAVGKTRYVARSLSCFRLHGMSQTARRSNVQAEFREQLQSVLDRHAQGLPNGNAAVGLAKLSLEVNVAMAAWLHKCPLDYARLLRSLAALSPRQWVRYLKYSRIIDRVMPRWQLYFRAQVAR